MKLDIPKVGMRTIKTAVAVSLSYLVMAPFSIWFPESSGGLLGQMGPFYACIAAVICMQSSVGQSVHQGVARLMGTAIGGGLGLLALITNTWLSNPIFMALVLCVGTVATIWLCNLIKRPAACAIGVVVLCVVLLNHAGPDRYVYAVARMIETGVGVLIAVTVNRLLPDYRSADQP